tara:strand:- start:378 stop:968 length:591 start_codon:yes stop_codon:yes gene_type:complete
LKKPNKKELIIFTTNTNKIKEIKKLLNKKITIKKVNNLNKLKFPKETGKTFSSNAKIKSLFGYNKFNIPCFAEDSGICIDALNGKPGVNSKRFIKEIGGIKNTYKYILKKVNKKKQLKAIFFTVIAFTYKKNKTVFFEGKKRGIIVSPLGKKGFAYDSIFKPLSSKKTYGQMTIKEKNLSSHRSIAIKKFLKYINS